jgi:uncharacterized cupredoxin-like copper-binding protein
MRHKVIWPALAVVLSAAGCGGTTHRALPVVSITERDFHIAAPHEVRAGDVTVVLKNLGPVSHELLIVHAGQNPLPRRVDGFTIDENALQHRLVVAIEPAGTGTRDVVVHLTPGRYILLCNMAGHAASGMQTSFRVR